MEYPARPQNGRPYLYVLRLFCYISRMNATLPAGSCGSVPVVSRKRFLPALVSLGLCMSAAGSSCLAGQWQMVSATGYAAGARADILWHSKGDGWLGLWEMNGTNLNALISLPVADTNLNFVGLADSDGDGNKDIL